MQQNRNFFYQMPFPVYFVGRSFRTVAYTHEDFARFKYSDRHSYIHIIDTQIVDFCAALESIIPVYKWFFATQQNPY